MSFSDYCTKVSEALGLDFRPRTAYNLCHVRPAYGVVHSDAVSGFDFFGWCDIDLVFGNIRKFYTEDVLAEHNVICTQPTVVSGYLTLIKNIKKFVDAYLLIPKWRQRIAQIESGDWLDCLDEAGLSGVFSPRESKRRELGYDVHRLGRYADCVGKKCGHITCSESAPAAQPVSDLKVPEELYTSNYFVEQWCTPYCPYYGKFDEKQVEIFWKGRPGFPERWTLRHNTLCDERGDEYLLFHFMNLKAKKWVHPAYLRLTTWNDLPYYVYFDAKGVEEQDAIVISRAGFHLIKKK